MKAQLDILYLPIIRYPAIDGCKIKESNENKVNHEVGLNPETKINLNNEVEKFVNKNNVVSWGEIGCWRSHLQVYFKILDKAKDTGIDGPGLILEDDIKMEKLILYELKNYLKLLPKDWDIFFRFFFRCLYWKR